MRPSLKTGGDGVQVGEASGGKSQDSHRNAGNYSRSRRPSFPNAGSNQNHDASDNSYYPDYRCDILNVIQYLAASAQRPGSAEQAERHDRNGSQRKGFSEA
jgi:hypothetical protein